ncbi:MAG: GyrI-like domain-containing protein [Candidatus Latescibacterota bacterium]
MEPRFVDRPAFSVMGVVAHGTPDRIDFHALWENGYMPHDALVKPLSLDHAYYGAWLASGEDGVPDYLAGMAVADDAVPPAGLSVRRVPAARYAVFECTLKTIGQTYGHVYQDWLPRSRYEYADGCSDFEYYPPDMKDGAPTFVYVPVRERRGR